MRIDRKDLSAHSKACKPFWNVILQTAEAGHGMARQFAVVMNDVFFDDRQEAIDFARQHGIKAVFETTFVAGPHGMQAKPRKITLR